MFGALPGYQPTLAQRAGDKAGNAIVNAVTFLFRRWRFILAYQGMCLALLLMYLYSSGAQLDTPTNPLSKRWGGWDERPLTEKCYRQERTAILLAIFLGPLGIDQWYAHHWCLAVFKMLTGGAMGVWSLVDVILWVVGGVYGTPGCRGGSGDWNY